MAEDDSRASGPPECPMPRRRIPMWWFAVAGLVGAGLGVYIEYLRRGKVYPWVWILVVVVYVAFLLYMRAAWKKKASMSAEEVAATVPSLLKGKRGIILIAVLVLYFMFSIGGDFREGWTRNKRRNEKAQMQAELREGTRVLQVAAGQPDSTGWVPATSSEGDFFVYVPAAFNEMCTDTSTLTACIIASQLGTTRFMAMHMRDSTPGKKSIETQKQDALARMGNSGSGRMKLLEERLYEGKYPLLTFEARAATSEGYARTVLTDDGSYILTVDGPEMNDDMRADAKRFFDSFKIVAEPSQSQ